MTPATRTPDTIRTSRLHFWRHHLFTHGNQFEIFTSGSDLYPRMLQSIDEAQRKVNLEVYIFRDDAVGKRFVRAMIRAAERGVTVRFILDAWGSFTFSQEFLHQLEEAGVDIIRYRPFSPFTGRWGWRRRDHRKLLTIDNEVGFVGGMNIGKEYTRRDDGGMQIRDTHLEVRGPVVEQINALFSYNWENHHHGLDELLPMMSQKDSPGRDRDCTCEEGESCARISGGWWKEKNVIREDYLERIERASDRIQLTQSYFLPTDDVLQALYEAASRGCRVQLLVPGLSDVPPVQYGTRYLYGDLLDHGVEVYEFTDSILHAKTAVIDEEWTTVGTFNFDYQSLFHNLEVNITVESASFARRMSSLFEEDLKTSRRISREDTRNWSTYESWLGRFWHFFRWAL